MWKSLIITIINIIIITQDLYVRSICLWIFINPLTTIWAMNSSIQCFYIFICKPLHQWTTQETGTGLFCSEPEVEGWVWPGLWQVAGVAEPSDLNSICPHAKGTDASEGEWHLDQGNHAHVQNMTHYTTQKTAQRRKQLWIFLEIVLIYEADHVTSVLITLRGPGWSTWYRQTSLRAIFDMLMVERRD